MRKKELLFAKDIITIDGTEYERSDIEKIKTSFKGTEGFSPFMPYFPSYTVIGNHKVAEFDVTSFCIEYDGQTGKIMDYILTTPYSFGAAVASLTRMMDTAPVIYNNGLLTSAEYRIGNDKKIAIGFMTNNPSGYNIVLMWE